MQKLTKMLGIFKSGRAFGKYKDDATDMIMRTNIMYFHHLKLNNIILLKMFSWFLYMMNVFHYNYEHLYEHQSDRQGIMSHNSVTESINVSHVGIFRVNLQARHLRAHSHHQPFSIPIPTPQISLLPTHCVTKSSNACAYARRDLSQKGIL